MPNSINKVKQDSLVQNYVKTKASDAVEKNNFAIFVFKIESVAQCIRLDCMVRAYKTALWSIRVGSEMCDDQDSSSLLVLDLNLN